MQRMMLVGVWRRIIRCTRTLTAPRKRTFLMWWILVVVILRSCHVIGWYNGVDEHFQGPDWYSRSGCDGGFRQSVVHTESRDRRRTYHLVQARQHSQRHSRRLPRRPQSLTRRIDRFMLLLDRVTRVSLVDSRRVTCIACQLPELRARSHLPSGGRGWCCHLH
jgi:hypothetical protein